MISELLESLRWPVQIEGPDMRGTAFVKEFLGRAKFAMCIFFPSFDYFLNICKPYGYSRLF